MTDRNARYQITGPKAFNRYGYSEQLPSLTTIYNDAISGERRVGGIVMKLIKVARDGLGGVETIRTPSGETLVYSSHAQTLSGWFLYFQYSSYKTVPSVPMIGETPAFPLLE